MGTRKAKNYEIAERVRNSPVDITVGTLVLRRGSAWSCIPGAPTFPLTLCDLRLL
jgi:hypothetical protein